MQEKHIIEILPQSVVEKIAAGEVVERPASVLKELVENAVDAGATRIDVAVEEAGFSMMRVSDNGSGMSREDLGRSVLPHATSKIRSADDLYSIFTMGFRGEALASISAVSRMNVVTSDGSEEGAGYDITVEGGVRGDIVPAARMRGTAITVCDLFFNVPARKKFMKTQQGERLAIVKILEQLAVPFPAIHFTATVDGKKILDLPSVGGLWERICAVAGNEFSGKLVECAGEGDGVSAQIFISSPGKLQTKPRFQSLYVNLRRIDNDSVTYAVREAFSQYLGHGNRPAFFCFLDVDPHKVDVNIHPTKQQMKFDDERGVFGFIFRTVRDGLRQSESVRQALHGLQQTDTAHGAAMQDVGSVDVAGVWAYSGGYSVGKGGYSAGANGNPAAPAVSDRPLDPDVRQGSLIRSLYGDAGMDDVSIYDTGIYDTGTCNAETHGASVYDIGTSGTSADIVNTISHNININNENIIIGKDGTADAVDHRPWEMIQCYQIHGLFILAHIKNGILLIDQHAAHERVLYEQALKDLEAGRPVSQQLLFPAVLEMSPAEKAVIESCGEYFSGLGFELADFGGLAVSVSAHPAFLKDVQVEDALRDMVRYLLDGREPDASREPAKRFAAAFACGAAVKRGQKLSQEEMNALINALFLANSPHTCPHGRPTLIRISVNELTRRFLR